jgi:Ras-related GTP-binding protein C/D
MQRISDQDKVLWKDQVPKIAVCGLKRSGKSSILRVLFNKLSPHEAGYIEPTNQPYFLPQSGNPLMNFRIAEIPGSWSSWEEAETLDDLFFSQCQSLILVIDSSSDDVPVAAFSLAKRLIGRALRVRNNRLLNIHLFLNKVDANYRFDPDSVQAESNKASFMQSIKSRISEEVKTYLGSSSEIEFEAHCTSIFDNSIHEAFSKVIQRPLLANGKIEQLLDTIVSTCRLEKAVLFDLVSKITFGSDSSQIDSGTFSLMQDLLEVIIDMISIYGGGPAGDMKSTACTIALSNGEMLFMKLIEKHLALVTIVKSENFDKTYLLNHNVGAFRNALMKVVSIMALVE